MNIDDGDIFLGEFANGALCSVQTSFVTVGNYPGIEARLYGSGGALICRLVEEVGICETLRAATPDQVEFRDLANCIADENQSVSKSLRCPDRAGAFGPVAWKARQRRE